MPVHFSMYQTAASGEYIEAMLAAAANPSNEVTALASYTAAGVDYLFYASTAGVSCISRNQTSGVSAKLGWITEADVNDICVVGSYLYVAHDLDVGRIATATMIASDADKTGSYTTAWASAAGATYLSAQYKIFSIDGQTIGNYDYLIYSYWAYWGAAYPYMMHIAKIVSSTGALDAEYYAWNAATRETQKVRMTPEGMAIGYRGFAGWVLNDVTAVSADVWYPDSGFGNGDDTCDDSTLSYLYGIQHSANVSAKSITEGAATTWQNWSLTANAEAEAYIYQHGASMIGDFEYVHTTGLPSTAPSPTLLNIDDLARKRIYLYDFSDGAAPNNNYIMVTYEFYYAGGLVKKRLNCDITVAGAPADARSVDFGTGGPATTLGIKIVRSGAAVTIFYNSDGAGWVQISNGGAGTVTYVSRPVIIREQLSVVSLNGSTFTWRIQSKQNTDPQITWSEFPDDAVDFAYLDAEDGAAGEATVALIPEGANGAIIGDYVLADPNTSVFESWGLSGKDHNVLVSSAINCVALEPGSVIGTGTFCTGYTNGGIEHVDLNTEAVVGFNANVGRILSGEIGDLRWAGSIMYGTDPAGAYPGGGFHDLDMDPPADTSGIIVRSHSDDDVLVGWHPQGTPDADFHHWQLYRSTSDGFFDEVLEDDGAWAVVAPPANTPYEFDEMIHAFHDIDVADEAYTYRVTAVDEGGNESAGTESDAEYVDEPIGAITLHTAASSTSDRLAIIDITGDSGDDSGNVVDGIYAVDVKEASQAWGDVERIALSGASPWSVPAYLPGAAGLKTIQARGISRSGKIGATVTVPITYSPVAVTTAAISAADHIKIAHRFVSDTAATFYCALTDSDFPETNLQDPRLAKVWRGSGGDEYVIRIALDQPETIDAFWMRNHNLSTWGAGATVLGVILCGSQTLPANPDNASSWAGVGGVVYQVSLSSLIERHSICHRPETDLLRYWAVVIVRTGVITSPPPYIGRIVLARRSDIWQPAANIDVDYTLDYEDQSLLHESEDQTIEAVVKDKRLIFKAGMTNMSEADLQTARQVFENVGLSDDLLVLIRPSDFMTGETAPDPWDPDTDSDWLFPPLYCQLARNLSIRGRPAGLGSFDIEFKEIVGGRNPYGIR